MTLGTAEVNYIYLDLHVLIKYHQANFTSHCIYSEHTFCAKHMTFKVHKYFPSTYTISSQDGTVQEGCDCTVSYTQEQVCYFSHSIQ